MKRSCCLTGLALLIAAPAMPASTQTSSRTLAVGTDMIVNGSLDGAAARFHMSLFGERTLVLHPGTAARLAIKPGIFRANGQVGRDKFKGSTAVKTYLINGLPIKRRIVWFERLFAQGVDGVIAPAAVPQDVISVELRPRQSGEQVHVLPLVSLPKTYGRMGAIVRIGDADVALVWDLGRATTLVTAAAAADLSAANSARFVGEKWQETVVFNVQRPVRRMAIAAPFEAGPIRLTDVTAWVGDYGDTSQVPDDAADPNEIVVVGKGSKIKPIHAILVGRNDMAHCSSIVFDKPRAQIRMSCR
jgi:hypothetical protein